MTQPWDQDKIDHVKRQIDVQATGVARRLNATHVTIIAWYEDEGGFFHMQDGGTAPMPAKDAYAYILEAYNRKDEGRLGWQEQ